MQRCKINFKNIEEFNASLPERQDAFGDKIVSILFLKLVDSVN